MGKATKGTTARKQTKAARREKQINFRERMIMAISEIGHVSLSPLIIILIFCRISIKISFD